MASSTFLAVPLCLLLCIISLHVSARIVLEDGYTVITIIDGHKLNINPHSVLQLPGSYDLLILDSANSAFYTVQFPRSQDSVVKKNSGSGVGYSDGGVVSAQFNKPRSFAADLNGNVYVADRTNPAIRKISRSGLGDVPAWTLGLGFGLLFLRVIYFVELRPCINSRTARLEGHFDHRDMEALPNQSGEDSNDTLLRHEKRSC